MTSFEHLDAAMPEANFISDYLSYAELLIFLSVSLFLLYFYYL